MPDTPAPPDLGTVLGKLARLNERLDILTNGMGLLEAFVYKATEIIGINADALDDTRSALAALAGDAATSEAEGMDVPPAVQLMVRLWNRRLDTLERAVMVALRDQTVISDRLTQALLAAATRLEQLERRELLGFDPGDGSDDDDQGDTDD